MKSFIETLSSKDKYKEIGSFIDIMKTYLGESTYGFCFVDFNGVTVYLNSRIEEITGYKENEIIGKHISELEFIPAEERKKLTDFPHKKSASSEATLMCDVELIKKDGSNGYISITIIPIEQKGTHTLIGNIIFVFDRSEFQKTQDEQKLSDIAFKSIQEGTLILNNSREIIQLNDAVERIFGVNAPEVIGKNLFDVIKIIEPLEPEVKLQFQNFEIEGYAHFEHLVKTPTTQLWTDVVLQKVKDDNGNEVAILAIVTDITKRKKIEEALRFSDAAFKAIKEGVIITDTEFNITYWNEASEMIYGVSASEAIGEKIFDIMDILKPSQAEIKKNFKKLKTIGYIHSEHLIKTGNRKLWIDAASQTIKNENEENIAILSIVTNIDERKKMEEALAEEIFRRNTLFEQTPVGIVIIDTTTAHIMEFNEIACRQLGYSREEFATLTIMDIEAKETAAETKASILKVQKEGSADFETLHRTKHGKIRNIHVIAQLVNTASGKVYQCVWQDITDSKQAERKLRESETRLAEAQEIAKLGNWHRDIKTGELFWSNEMYRLLGYQPGEVPPSKELYLSLAHADDRELLNKAMNANTDKGTPFDIVSRFYRKDGEIWFANSKSRAILDETGKPIELFGSIQDITEQKNAEEKEKQMQQEIDITSRLASIGEMASGIAHEINNPLTSIIGFSQLLMNTIPPETIKLPEDKIKVTHDSIKEDLKTINQEAQRVAKIVSGLLTFARQQKQGWSIIDINEIISDTLELRLYTMKMNNIKVKTELSPSLPNTVGDRGQMQQVFMNIILNAEYALEQVKNRTFLVKTEHIDGIIKISFTDNGPGISKENLGKIFEPFFTTKEVGMGTGLGLSICHGIISQHGGRIYARSKSGHGASIIIELPVKKKTAASKGNAKREKQ
jgi:PAS domain S-box-containing protein